MQFTVVSYFTENTPYEKEAKGFIESLDRFGVDHDIQPVPHLGNWQANTVFKATFILQMLKKHAPRPIVWMDVDSILQKKPIFFNMIDSDVALYYRTTGGRIERIPEESELISATMYFKTNSRAEDLLNMWIAENEKGGSDLEQHNLQKVIPAWRKKGGIHSILPQQYCKIFDSDTDKTVIVQNQASRRFRHKVGWS